MHPQAGIDNRIGFRWTHATGAGGVVNCAAALLEIMGSNLRTKESVVLGESEGKSFYEIIEASYTFGWSTFDHSALDAYKAGIITEETALAYCNRRGIVARGIDQIKKTRGEMVGAGSDLRMVPGAERPGEKPSGKPASNVPPNLKLKM